ncbi:MAG TPA: 3'(2'),5'-bisphosphate nucleotidase [Cytophagales bacterium]|nr:3'(2'),5'-bisphosphate nucleotidase [Cytophagales bacterium]HAA18407.1 3'(2'),5'-bisphosphate nucleotidase [Cytophagales bacterium]HAP61456.1 3'(2'),5'-bisphosphate nucleotidase [Cytophagales bacterium]
MQIQDIIRIAREAGDKILEIYHDEDFSKVVDFKDDNSPLTLADKASHEVIDAALRELTPNIPILSEEGRDMPFEERKGWTTFWCVDPLDGTKEFIKRNGQFTVNIALVENGVPTLGVIHTPVTGETYYGTTDGAYKKTGDATAEKIAVRNNQAGNRIAVGSASHAAPEEEELLAKYDVTESLKRGSSLKFCMVAEGKADIYYRHNPTMEWDTAAGQAVVEAAGGTVFTGQGQDSVRFFYNKENLRNGSFLVLGF